MEVPLGGITNGVHMGTWLGTAIKNLYETYLGYGWMEKQDSPALWKKIDTIPDRSLWEAHQIQKNKFVDELKDRILTEYTNRDESNRLIKDTLKCLDSNTLMICFSRRFAAYKRPDLILKSRDRLARILNNPERPVVLLFAGKAHPADGIGKDLIKNIVEASRDEIFKGRIIFIENYGMLLAKRLTQGVDVWLNNPVRYKEASGTSGMKAGLNGVLNFSIKDGWWDEVCAPEIGFKIKSFEHLGDTIKRNEMEAMFLLDTLEYSVVPTYYEDKLAGFNPAWVKKMKESIKVISCQYNTRRMVKDYFKDLYNINAVYAKKMLSDDAKGLKNLVSWTENLESRFSTVKIKTILVHGIEDGKLTANGLLKVRMLLFSGKLKANELKVELVLIKNSSDHLVSKPSIIPLELSDKRESGILSYMLEHHIEDTGFYSYGIRVYPYNPLMLHPQTVGLVYWG